MASQPQPEPAVCNRCLINVNATIPVRAKIPGANGSIRMEHFDYPTDPIALKEWAESVLAEGGRIEVGNTTDHFKAFSTWHGDPVCVVHLWELRDIERRSEAAYIARALRPR